MPTNGWGYYMQGSDQQIEREELGLWLNEQLRCAIHYPAFGKPLFECSCGVVFPEWAVKACKDLGSPDMLLSTHATGYHISESVADSGKINPSIRRYTDEAH